MAFYQEGMLGWVGKSPLYLKLFGAAALSALALPPVSLFPVLLISLPILIGAVADAESPLTAFQRGFFFGFAHHLFGLYWITEAILVRASEFWWLVPLAVPALSLVLAGFIAAPCALAWFATSSGARLLILAGTWVLCDLARQFVGTGFPWNLWGSCLEVPGTIGTVLIQPAMLIGVHGLTLAVLLWAGTPTLKLHWRLTGLAVFLVWIGFGLSRLAQRPPPPSAVTAVLVQGNVPETVRWDPDNQARIFRKYLDLTRLGLQEARPRPAVVIWPETASPYILTEDSAARAAIAAVTGPSVPALIGSIRFEGQNPYNSLVVLDPAPHIAAIYDKWHLVPFGEYQPSWLSGLQLGLVGGLGFGRGPQTVEVAGLPPFGALICYEAVFSGQIVDEHRRPRWLVNITNDAWFGNTTGPRQHLAAARMRAVEEGLPLLRAANTGISAGFDAFGREIGRLPLNEAGVAVIPVPGYLPPTGYARFGLFVPFFLASWTLCIGLTLAWVDRRHCGLSRRKF